jgi:hypothetical protein
VLDEPRTDMPEPDEVRDAIDVWDIEARASRRGAKDVGYSPAPDGAGWCFVLHEFQPGLRPLRPRDARDRLAAGQP